VGGNITWTVTLQEPVRRESKTKTHVHRPPSTKRMSSTMLAMVWSMEDAVPGLQRLFYELGVCQQSACSSLNCFRRLAQRDRINLYSTSPTMLNSRTRVFAGTSRGAIAVDTSAVKVG